MRDGDEERAHLIPPKQLIEVFTRDELLSLPIKVLGLDCRPPLGEDIVVDLVTTHLRAVVAGEAQFL